VCGIVGYTGFRDAKDVVIDCLKRLEYRGYDSAGIAVLNNKINVYKKVGEISKIEKNIPDFKGNTGISHTRWATMGAVNEKNAHPHSSCDKKISLVHNGIIENYKKLKETLVKKGHIFSSNTDTEVIAHLIEEEYKKNKDFEKAFVNAVAKLQGSYAIVAICTNQKNKIFVARKESPIVIGIGDSENFVASDIPALLKYTNRVIYLDDEEFCTIDADKVTVYDSKHKIIQKEEQIINWDIKDAEKSGFPHFMLKEIYDQVDTINQVLRGRISEINRTIGFNEHVEELLNKDINSIHIVACGTSYYAGLVGRYIIEKLTGIPVFVEFASEYRYFGIKNEKSLVIGITQSGETADTLGALREAKNSGCKTLTITNVIGSTATRVSDGYILMQSGPEIGVAATKTFTSQILVLFLIALKMGITKNKIGADELYEYIHYLRELPRKVRNVLDKNNEILNIAKTLKNAKSVFFIGRGINYPLSLEGALKLKEISYIHAEGFAAGELKHGPFALLTKVTPVIVIATKDETYDKILANIGEVKARGPQVIAIAEEDDTEIEKHADFVLRVPGNSSFLSSIPIVVILQLLAYHVADLCECSIDKPRNLAKSVTVE
jgi:glutamine---fructose-6-phosphate transaminase (isomerizing)